MGDGKETPSAEEEAGEVEKADLSVAKATS